MVSYLVRQGQREEVKPIGVPLCNDLGQSLVVSHPANHLLLFEVVHGDWGAHWYRPVIQVTIWAMCSIIALMESLLRSGPVWVRLGHRRCVPHC